MLCFQGAVQELNCAIALEQETICAQRTYWHLSLMEVFDGLEGLLKPVKDDWLGVLFLTLFLSLVLFGEITVYKFFLNSKKSYLH